MTRLTASATWPSCSLSLLYVTLGCGPQFWNLNLMMYLIRSLKTVILVKQGHILWRKCPLVFLLMSYDSCALTLIHRGSWKHKGFLPRAVIEDTSCSSVAFLLLEMPAGVFSSWHNVIVALIVGNSHAKKRLRTDTKLDLLLLNSK